MFSSKLTEEQSLVFNILQKAEYNESNKIQADYKEEIRKVIPDQKKATPVLAFASYVVKEIEKYGKEYLSDAGFDEKQLLVENLETIQNLTNSNNIVVQEFDEKNKPKQVKTSPIPGKPVLFCD